MGQQLAHDQALLGFARELMAPHSTGDENRAALTRAMEALRIAADARRAFIYRNLTDPQAGPISVLVAEAAGVPQPVRVPMQAVPIVGDPHLEALPADRMVPQWATDRVIPWSNVPQRIPQLLEAGQPVGGPVTELFAETPQFLAWLLREPGPTYSMQLFPIFNGTSWWGYVGVEDGEHTRGWAGAEVAMLGSAAEMMSNTLTRWEVENSLDLARRYDRALSRFSQELLQNPATPDQEAEILNQALDHLVAATQASRAYAVRNFDDLEFGPCVAIYAEACAPNIRRHILNPGNQRARWSLMSAGMRQALVAGEPYGGPTPESFADAPFMLDQFLSQQPPLLSLLTVPVHLDDVWWGFLGFDETKRPRRWTEHEVIVLRTAAEMVSSALRRWRAEAQVLRERDELESRVEARTAELRQRLVAEELLARSAARLMSADDTKTAIREILADIGAITRSERVALAYFAENSHPDANRLALLEWRTPGAPLTAEQAERELGGLAWLNAQMVTGRVATFASPRQLPAEAAAFKELMALDDDRPIIMAPLHARNVPLGMLICANTEPREEHPSPDLRAFEVIVGLLAGLLEREANLRTLEQRVADRTRELSIFLDMGLLASEGPRFTESLEIGLLRIMEVTGTRAACIHVLDEDRAKLKLVGAQGLSGPQRNRLQDLALSAALAAWLEGPSPPLLRRLSHAATDLPRAMRLAAYPQWLLAQLRARGTTLGILSCYAGPAAEFTINQVSLVSGFAEQLGVVIQNQRLRQQAERLAVVSERQRLARELHDAITQSLYSQTLFARSAIDALNDGHLDKTGEHLHQLEVSASQALREMRVLLHQLRPLDLAHRGLREAIEERLALVERRVGLLATSEIDPEITLDEATEDVLYRVTLEALNNSLRHAHATQVDVQLHRTADGLDLFVIDNGEGFDLEEVTPGLGLSNIRERAAQVSGELHIDSRPGRGTALLLKVPAAARHPAVHRPRDGGGER